MYVYLHSNWFGFDTVQYQGVYDSQHLITSPDITSTFAGNYLLVDIFRRSQTVSALLNADWRSYDTAEGGLL